MEQLFSATKGTKRNVFADPSHRMSQRPLAVKCGEGLGFQDFGSSFGPPKSVNTYGRSHDRKYKPAAAFHEKSRKLPSRISEDDSDDELLLSSQNSVGSYATSSPKRVSKGKKPCDDEETVHVNGRALAAHPDFKPSSLDAIKGLRFTKTKKPSPSSNDVTEISPESSLPNSQDLFKPISDDIEIVDDRRRSGPSSRQKPSETSLTRRKSPTATRTAAHQTADVMGSSTSKPSPSTTHDTQRKARPRPRVITKSVPPNRDSSPESTPRKRDIPPRNKTSEQHTNTEGKRTSRNPTLSSSRREPQEFPLLQARENVSDDARSSDTSSKTKKGPISRSATSGRGPKPIPLPSPLRAKPVSLERAFPNLSPLSSSKEKGKAREKTPEDDANLTDGRGKRAGPKPFPMSSQMFAGIDRRSKSPTSRSHKSAKRASSDDSSVEQGHNAKKRKDSRSGLLDSLDYLHEPMDDDSLELGYARDPSKMCPYCDEDLPSHPTPFLQHLLTTARKKAIPDPRPKNRGGLKAPLTVYVSVCQRHRFELHQLPIATEKGWPKTIDFSKVPARVKKMKKALEDIIMDKDDTSDVENLDVGDGFRGPGTKSVFWREVKKEVKKQGSRTVTGVKGQFASFEKTQPGYYGELGSVIIHQTLFDVFPPSSFDPSLIAPLAPAEFIQRVLVPEAAVRLIAQDLCINIEDAVATLRESAQYGVSMFPDTSETKRKGAGVNDDEIGVADRIVMERARARRKELAEEEKLDEVILEEERAAQRAKARESRREKALERAKQAREANAHVEDKAARDPPKVPEGNATRKTRRETRQWTATDDSESDAMSVDSSTSRRSARIANKGVRGNGANVVLQLEGSDSDVGFFNDSGHKSRNGKRNTKERSTDRGMHVGTETITPRERTKPLSRFGSLDNDESTPRPVLRRKMDTTTTEVAVGGERPLQVARNRIGTSTHDGWLDSLRTGRCHDTDSDMSTGSRRSMRPPIRKGAPIDWLFSDPSSTDSS